MWITRGILHANVSAAREEDTVQTGIDRFPSIIRKQGWDKNWHPSRLKHSVDIRLHEQDDRLPICISRVVRSNSNKRLHDSIVKQKDPKD
jgi:hypothetical protein